LLAPLNIFYLSKILFIKIKKMQILKKT